jgi:hypothetical protein
MCVVPKDFLSGAKSDDPWAKVPPRLRWQVGERDTVAFLCGAYARVTLTK